MNYHKLNTLISIQEKDSGIAEAVGSKIRFYTSNASVNWLSIVGKSAMIDIMAII
jgi:hypothetical protein